jgi:UDP-N-acetylmuramoyl-L-alanyl-D-glutamate--2,6-diaminopimelate ligase
VKTLSQLLRGVAFEVLQGDANTPVHSLATDSRTAQPRDAFVCLPGYNNEGGETRADRHEFAADAAAHGATCFVVERPIAVPHSVTVVRVANCWEAASRMACEIYGSRRRA